MQKILLVEDDRVTSRVLMVRLKNSGYDVIPVFDAAMATTMAVRHHPDLVLMDVMLPAGDGFVVAARLQQLSATCTVPIIIMTASRDPDLRERANRMGAVAFLAKPIDPLELLRVIKGALQPGPAPV